MRSILFYGIQVPKCRSQTTSRFSPVPKTDEHRKSATKIMKTAIREVDNLLRIAYRIWAHWSKDCDITCRNRTLPAERFSPDWRCLSLPVSKETRPWRLIEKKTRCSYTMSSFG
jgi:hypothetical protein